MSSLSATELSAIEERASNLSERLDGKFTATQDDDRLADLRLSKWQELAAGSWERQMRALTGSTENASILERQARSLVGSVKRLPGFPPAPWIHRLEELVEAVATSFARGSHPAHPTSKGWKIPYQHLFLPIAEDAWSRLPAARSAFPPVSGERARIGLQEMLVRRIAGIAASVLQTKFLVHCSLSESGMAQDLFGTEAHTGDDLCNTRQYASFIAEQGENGMSALFMNFPVVARLIAEATQQWSGFVGEFLSRFEEDRVMLAREFNGGASLGRLHSVKGNLSDPHRGGRSVLIIELECGLRLVYKPRATGVDRAFNALLAEINDLAPNPGLRALKICDREGYGWMEFAEHNPCTGQRAAGRFYHRAGMLACLLHWLHGIDFHRENVVAAGEQPVLVDLEALCHPLREGEAVADMPGPPWPLAGTVLRPGLLPVWQKRFAGSGSYDNSGLGAPVKMGGLSPSPTWTDVNTDRMQVCQKSRGRTNLAHRPTLDGRVLSVRAFQSDVLAGYRRMASLLKGRNATGFARCRETICATTRRRIKRHTLVYKVLLLRSLQPECLSSGADRSIALLALPCEPGDESDWRSEIASLEGLDVPYFQTHGDALNISGHPPSWDSQERLVRLSLKRKLQIRDGLVHERHSIARDQTG